MSVPPVCAAEPSAASRCACASFHYMNYFLFCSRLFIYNSFVRHIPVLLNEVLNAVGELRGKTVVDATFGAGGYSRAFLERGANVIAFDRDSFAAPIAEEFAQEFPGRLFFMNASFSEIISLEAESVNSIVFDFGVSSMQIDSPERGFSWRFDASLDMRMSNGANAGKTAAELIEDCTAAELAQILREYGDLKKAAPIARAMKSALPRTTFQLRDLIHNPKDFAPVFQALRIAVNDELGEIKRALDAVPRLLAPGGVCACVTFHSLEDRMVKHKFREWTAVAGDPRMPLPSSGNESESSRPGSCAPAFQLLKTIKPSAAELNANPRARSAHLRAVLKKI
jgi:16S rRNA (cytosine1402-N4)-methyltransferase